MSRLVPHSLSLSSTMFWKRLIKNENLAVMNLHYRGKKLVNGEAYLWADIANPSEKRNPKYIDKISSSKKPAGYKLAAPITQSTLGWNINSKGKIEPMFIFLKGKIDADLQANALAELKRQPTPFKSCAKSGRPELKQAVRYNGHKNPEASEWNPGFREKKRYGYIEPVSDLTPYPELRALLEQMSDIFRRFFPRKWGHAFTMCPEPFRLKGKSGRSLPYSRLAILKSAASAIHVDADTVPYGAGEQQDVQTGDGEAKATTNTESEAKPKTAVPKIQGKISVKPPEPTPVDPNEEEQKLLSMLLDQWEFYKLPELSPAENFDSWIELIRKHGFETVGDVMAWMMFINKHQYWKKNCIHSVADFARCFPKMHEQYEKCGGSDLEKALEVAGKKYAEELKNSNVRPQDCAPANYEARIAAQQPRRFPIVCVGNGLCGGRCLMCRSNVPEGGPFEDPESEDGESFRVEDVAVSASDGLD